jgi:hypothetical protein
VASVRNIFILWTVVIWHVNDLLKTHLTVVVAVAVAAVTVAEAAAVAVTN